MREEIELLEHHADAAAHPGDVAAACAVRGPCRQVDRWNTGFALDQRCGRCAGPFEKIHAAQAASSFPSRSIRPARRPHRCLHQSGRCFFSTSTVCRKDLTEAFRYSTIAGVAGMFQVERFISASPLQRFEPPSEIGRAESRMTRKTNPDRRVDLHRPVGEGRDVALPGRAGPGW